MKGVFSFYRIQFFLGFSLTSLSFFANSSFNVLFFQLNLFPLGGSTSILLWMDYTKELYVDETY